jgi:hypothetical protein
LTEVAQLSEEFRKHISKFWAGAKQEEIAWGKGPIEETLPGFRVRRIQPRTDDEPWVYVSVGASEVETKDPRLEFLLLAPGPSDLHVETVTMVAGFHADPRFRLELGATMRIGRPWISGSECDALYVSLPYPYGPTLEWCDVGRKRIRLLWLVPITERELGLIRERGAEVFERALERSGENVVAPHRSDVSPWVKEK